MGLPDIEVLIMDNFIKGIIAVEEGWVKVDLLAEKLDKESDPKERERLKEDYLNTHDAKSVNEWCKANCGDYVMFGGKYYFKEDKDATWFSMRWIL
jgi:hypothetical protein